MAEGRWLPWKEQKMDIRPTPDYKELGKPLKAPPHGLEWRRMTDGAWELRTAAKAHPHGSEQSKEEEDKSKEKQGKEKEGVEKESAPEFLEHVVMPDDTLAGICIKYKVKDRELRKLNGFVGEHFRMCDSLIVPNRFAPGQQPVQGAVGKQPITKEDMMQVFRKTSRLGTEETKFYLESSGWDLSKALAEWRAEHRWEAEQMKLAKSGTASGQRTLERHSLRRRPVSGTTTTPHTASRTKNGYIFSGIEMSSQDSLAEARVPLLTGTSYSSATML